MNLEELYASDDQSYLILAHMNNNFFMCEKWEECNSFIKGVEIDRLSSSGIRSICVCAHHAKTYLPYYKELYRACYDRMLTLCGDKTDRLLWFILEELE